MVCRVGPRTGLAASALGSPQIFTLTQEGGKLTGAVEGPGGWFGGDDAPAPIHDGGVDGDHVSFKSGINVFDGKIKGGEMELQRTVNIPFSLPTPRNKILTRLSSVPRPTAPILPLTLPILCSGSMSVVLRRSER